MFRIIMGLKEKLAESVKTGILKLDYMGLTSLPDLPPKLKYLMCSNNQLTSLPHLPTTLKALYCNNNQLDSLPPLPDLTHLSCVNNRLTSLPQLPDNLLHLECHHNQITELPYLPDSLVFLNCYNNKLSSVPALPDNLYYFKHVNNTFNPEIQEILKSQDHDLPIDIEQFNNHLEEKFGLRRKPSAANARRKTEKRVDTTKAAPKRETRGAKKDDIGQEQLRVQTPEPKEEVAKPRGRGRPKAEAKTKAQAPAAPKSRFLKTKKILDYVPQRLTKKIRRI